MNLIERVKNILLTPKTEWPKINNEQGTLASLLPTYSLPLAAIGSVGFIIGYGLIGIRGFTSLKVGLIMAALLLVCVIVTVVAASFIADALAPTLGAQKDINKSTQWVVYGLTPLYIALFLGIIPSVGGGILWLIIIAGFAFSGYLMFLGAPELKKTAPDKTVAYTAAVVVASIVIFIIIEKIGEKVLYEIMFGSRRTYRINY
ncbi:MAG: Yip1 family protein [Bacteroidota bacterium]|nr:Yip1 family protein [Bacteroidota bacterium]